MKLLYSQLKELIPALKASPKEAGRVLTMVGFMMDSLKEVKFNHGPDWLMSFEIRQNRADCLSVFGLARELAGYYGLKINWPKIAKLAFSKDRLEIKVEAAGAVKRISAVKMTGLKNTQSPAWLKDYLELQGINSVNLLVDLSNYVMFLTGYPSHLIDVEKMTGNLRWSLNKEFNRVTTLFGTVVPLKKDQELIIRDDKNIIATALVGSRAAEISLATTEVIAEVATYDRAVIRKNSRDLNIVTEASHRLEKELDPNGTRAALELLIGLIKKSAGGEVASALFDYYPKKYASPAIKFDPRLPGQFAGVAIAPSQAIKILKNLNCALKKSGAGYLVTPPTYRQDLNLAEDLVEEVIRLFGYEKIVAEKIPSLEVAPNITPKNIILAEKARDILTSLGFDEILSWPLTKHEANSQTNYLAWQEIATQNSINDLCPDLRQSMATGLFNQLAEYEKNNVEAIKIFEIGKIFGQIGKKYLEDESLGLLSAATQRSLDEFKNQLEILLRSLGLTDLKYFTAAHGPAAANPESCWEILAQGQAIGLIYKLKPRANKLNVYFAEINITSITALLKKVKNYPVVELTRKLISLDANVELAKNESIYKYLTGLEKKLDKDHLFSLNISDVFPLTDKVRYTIRVVYKELSDQEAKKIHLQAFGL
ncbi:MAG: phenylalanine--tRNA ligase subunit beta [Patescibacteria group bacterium]|nr:phenylalanine--tRNA ligase subunit beta [Patescibacteria group bacterium]